jgi:hypothetical protein
MRSPLWRPGPEPRPNPDAGRPSRPPESSDPAQINDSPCGDRIAIHGVIDMLPPGMDMLPLSRPLFDQNAARLMTLCVAAALFSCTLVVATMLAV